MLSRPATIGSSLNILYVNALMPHCGSPPANQIGRNKSVTAETFTQETFGAQAVQATDRYSLRIFIYFLNKPYKLKHFYLVLTYL